MKTSPKFASLLSICLLLSLGLIGCGSSDTDPHAKVDAPGYYNGPVDTHKGAKGGSGATDKAPAGGAPASGAPAGSQ